VTDTQTQIQADVAAELRWEPRVDHAAIAVSVGNDTVTLRGTVGSLGAKHAATKAAQRVSGVRRVDNELEVGLLTAHRREDADLRGSILRSLSRNVLVPDGVDATVKDGVVTLTGTVDSHHQREEAERTIQNVHGVTRIDDQIKIRDPRVSADVSERIARAFERNAQTDAREVRVESINGTATLSGVVHSLAEYEAALEAAWAASGVVNVIDRLEIHD